MCSFNLQLLMKDYDMLNWSLLICCLFPWSQVFIALIMTAVGVSRSSSMASDSSKAKTSTTSIFAFLDRKSKIDASDDFGTTLEDVKGDIVLQDVSFKYPTRPDVQIFQDLCLTIRSNKVSFDSLEF